MVFKGKEVKVGLISEAKLVYFSLQDEVKEELNSEKIGTDKQKLLASINRVIEQLKVNPQFGVHVKKQQIPKHYIDTFGTKNIWKCDLAFFWRLIYYVDGSDKVTIVSFVVDIFNHKDYNKKFNYRRS